MASMRLLIGALALSVVAGAVARSDPDGDAARGAVVYKRCIGCHSLDRDRTGPRHCGVFGRPAGAVPGFKYSAAMRASALVWDTDTLDGFLENPLAFLPRTRMTYGGVKDRRERLDLIAYLRQAGADPSICGLVAQ